MKFSEEYIDILTDRAVERYRRKHLPEICQYCNTAMLMPSGKPVSKQACIALQHVCNSCFAKIKLGQLEHSWS